MKAASNALKDVWDKANNVCQKGQNTKNGFSGQRYVAVMMPVLMAIIYFMIIAVFVFRKGSISKTGFWEAGGHYVVLLATLFLMINLAVLVWRLVLVCRYRPLPGCHDHDLPRCTVVVPAYNEGRQVMTTLKSLAASDYPAEKLQIISVDDGSLDDTWQWMIKAKRELGDRITILKLPHNQGKRKALYHGFRKSVGDVLVTVDSDSTVERETLRNLVTPFVQDSLVGGVAGNVRVLNPQKGMIPRMLDVVFVYSFDFIRAAQSEVNAVMCTPGALSAYRRTVVIPVLDEWMQQKFCGCPATIGEDRAMTNLILREGYHVLFQQNAMVYTDVPVRYEKLCKMFLRWARSNIRETIAMSGFAFRPFRKGPMLGARINLILSWMGLTKNPVCLMWVWCLMISAPLTFGPDIISGILCCSSIWAVFFFWRYRSMAACWAFGYGIFWFFALFWINPYALLTPHRSGWLTRDINV